MIRETNGQTCDARSEREARDQGREAGDNGRQEVPKGNGRAEAGRDEKGRFAEWNKGGPGNPFARQTAGLRKALCNAVTEEDIAEIARGLVQRAKEGDLAATKLLLSYTVGKPEAVTNPDTLDRKEWEHFRAGAVPILDVRDMYRAFTPAFACAMMRDILPEVMKGMGREFGRQVRERDEEREAWREAEGKGRGSADMSSVGREESGDANGECPAANGEMSDEGRMANGETEGVPFSVTPEEMNPEPVVVGEKEVAEIVGTRGQEPGCPLGGVALAAEQGEEGRPERGGKGLATASEEQDVGESSSNRTREATGEGPSTNGLRIEPTARLAVNPGQAGHALDRSKADASDGDGLRVRVGQELD